jgi:hypothetical protein
VAVGVYVECALLIADIDVDLIGDQPRLDRKAAHCTWNGLPLFAGKN